MKKVKVILSKSTSFPIMYRVCLILAILGLLFLGFSVTEFTLMIHREGPLEIRRVLENSGTIPEYSWTMCSIIATIALVGHTTLTVLIGTSQNKTFGIELKEFLKNCRWRLRPLVIFLISILAIIEAIVFSVCGSLVLLFVLLVWLVLYISCYTLIVWKLIINTEFTAEFLKLFFEKSGQGMIEEKEQMIGKIMNCLVDLNNGEQVYGIQIVKKLMVNASKTLKNFYITNLETAFHNFLKQKGSLDHNVFINICDEVGLKDYSYIKLLTDTSNKIKNMDKESKEKYLLLKKIKSYIINSSPYNSIVNFLYQEQLNEKQDEESIKQYLKNNFTSVLDKDGFILACNTLVTDAKEMEMDNGDIIELFKEAYEKLQNAAPEYVGKYDMGRHFSEFTDMFFRKDRDKKIYTSELRMDIIYIYFKSIMINPSMINEKQAKLLYGFISAGLWEYCNRWKTDLYEPQSNYETFIRKAIVYCEILIFGDGLYERNEPDVFSVVLTAVDKYEDLIPDLVRKIHIDLLIMLLHAWQEGKISVQELRSVLQYKTGTQNRSLYKVYRENEKFFVQDESYRIVNEVLGYLRKEEVSLVELQKARSDLKKNNRRLFLRRLYT